MGRKILIDTRKISYSDVRGSMSVAKNIPAPEQYLGFSVGTDRCLADWSQIVGYFSCLMLVRDLRLQRSGRAQKVAPSS